MTEAERPDNKFHILEKESAVESEKYPDLTVKHEVLLDWIINFAMEQGRMPSRRECEIGYAFKGYERDNLQYMNALLLPLYEKGYLIPEGGKIKRHKYKGGNRHSKGAMRTEVIPAEIVGIGNRIREPLVKVLFGRVFVGPCPKNGMLPDEAMELAWRLDRASRLAERS